jgi:hypothetical protein
MTSPPPRCSACGARLEVEPDGTTSACRLCTPTVALSDRSIRSMPIETERLARALCTELAAYDSERLAAARAAGRVREDLAEPIAEARELFIARAGEENIAAFEAAVDAVLVLGEG